MEYEKEQRVKRTQRDYSFAFKMLIVHEVEKGQITYKQAQAKYGIQGRSTVLTWLRKYGQQDWTSKAMPSTSKRQLTPQQRIRQLEKQLAAEKLKTEFIQDVIYHIDKECGRDLGKKVYRARFKDWQAQRRLNVSRYCEWIGITRQAYYQSEKRAQIKAQETQQVLELVMEYRYLMPSIGTRKLYWLIKPKLLEQGLKFGRDQLFKVLKENDLLIRPKRRYTKTTDSKHWMKKHPNLLKDYSPIRANEVFVSDITYVESAEGVHYLSLVTDAYTRQIKGYKLSSDMRAENVVQALHMAMKSIKDRATTLIHHSDRGSQYCSELYQSALQRYGISPSMTDGGDCYQNALAERINGILKQEFLTTRCKTMKELDHLISESIVIYNCYRPHLSLNMITPNQMYEKAKTELIA
ncbi:MULTISPECIES: IS3 family transposase [Acinetobacter]|nr:MULTISPECIES: IS3 family transposase [Acinetobacter]QHI17462.1 IS3 family transposase [Acinetobacter haemolyticus]QHI22089.1 IS3 family transposase [Acinetobacter haemolyticus]QHI25107.1 IS3 family transposase [Acinetobacter haemolyticus]QHI25159.1 IS3 family transposase [Acinetobacter haemolyticus]QHI25221.1 IS3 family transposase [Acinetobacter haemolyticus]